MGVGGDTAHDPAKKVFAELFSKSDLLLKAED